MMQKNMGTFGIFLASLMMPISHSRIISHLSSSSPRQGRLSLAQPMPYYLNRIDGHPGAYSFGYDVADPLTGNTQFRTEERYPNGTVVGSYGYVDAWGRPQHYTYVADERGYRVTQDLQRRPYVSTTAAPPAFNPSYYPAQSPITWTRPKKPYKKKNNNYYRPPINNFIGPPSSYAED